MRLKFELNQTEFIIRIVDNNWKPSYICESDMEAIIYYKESNFTLSIIPYIVGYSIPGILQILGGRLMLYPGVYEIFFYK